MSATDSFTMVRSVPMFRPAAVPAKPAGDATPLPAVVVVVMVANAVAGISLMMSGIDLSAFLAM